MKKTFTVNGYGRNNQTTDTCRKQIENGLRRIEELKYDLENWHDIPQYETKAEIKNFEKHVERWTNILNWAIEKGYDKELEEV